MLFALATWLIMIPCISSAEYNSNKMGQAVGGLLAATDMLMKFSNSECSYIVIKSYSVDKTFSEVLPYLPKKDRVQAKDYFTSSVFEKQLQENDRFIEGFLAAGKKDGLDTKTLCGMMASIISMNYPKAVQQWEYAKENYSK